MAKTMIVIGLRSPVLALVLLGVSQTGGQVFTRNATRAEVAYAAALGEARPELSTTRVSRTGSSQWVGGAYASISAAVDLVFATPFDSEAVLIVNPVTGATDTTVLGGFSNDVGKWSGMAFCPSTDKLYAPPYNEASVLVINPQTNTTDTAALGGLGFGPSKWAGIDFAPSVGLLFAAPFSAAAVLMINPVTNVTDIITLGGLSNGQFKWVGIAYAPSVGMLYASPLEAGAVLIINPRTNTTDVTTLVVPRGGSKWYGIAFAASVNKLFAAPHTSGAVLVVDPHANSTDFATMDGLGVGISNKWLGIAYAPSIDRLFAAPLNSDAVLIIDPHRLTTDNTTLGNLTAVGKTVGAVYAVNSDTVLMPPHSQPDVLTVGFAVNLGVVTPLRQIAALTNTVATLQDVVASAGVAQGSLQSALSQTNANHSALLVAHASTRTELLSTQSTLLATQNNLSSTQLALSSSITAQSALEAAQASTAAELSAANVSRSTLLAAQRVLQVDVASVGSTVCNRPVCAAGTQPVNGTCVPDCPALTRRGVSCEPYCDPTSAPGDTGTGGNGSPVGVVIAAAVAVAIVMVVVVLALRSRAPQRGLSHRRANGETTAMFINPMHQAPGDGILSDVPEPTPAEAPSPTMTLDTHLYVAPGQNDSNSSAPERLTGAGCGERGPSVPDNRYDTFLSPTASTPNVDQAFRGDVGRNTAPEGSADQAHYDLFRGDEAQRGANVREQVDYNVFRDSNVTDADTTTA